VRKLGKGQGGHGRRARTRQRHVGHPCAFAPRHLAHQARTYLTHPAGVPPAASAAACKDLGRKTWDERLGTKDLGAKDPGAKELGPKVEGLLGAKKVLTKRSTAPRLSMACRCQFEGAFQKHDSRCELEGETATHEVKLQIQPKVTFSQGKAVKATLNWGKIAAPRLAKTGGRQRLGRVAASSWTTSTGSFIGAKGGVAGQITARLYPRCAPARAPNRSCLCGASPSPPHPRRGRRFP
jgi:hypothetical protein